MKKNECREDFLDRVKEDLPMVKVKTVEKEWIRLKNALVKVKPTCKKGLKNAMMEQMNHKNSEE